MKRRRGICPFQNWFVSLPQGIVQRLKKVKFYIISNDKIKENIIKGEAKCTEINVKLGLKLT